MSKINKEKGPGLGSIKKSSVGLPAILSTLNMGLFDLGPGKSTRVMRKMNQFDGFDCPGCAWPDPDDERTPFGEYCENGIKAIATEADSKTIYADFFKNHSIDEASKGNVTLEDNTEGDQYSEQVSSNFEGDANAAVFNMAFEKLIEVFVCFYMHLFL